LPDWTLWREMARETIKAARTVRTNVTTPLNQVNEWLDDVAAQRGMKGVFHAKYIRTDGKWLHFAVKLTDVGDSADRAKILQEIEDEWDALEPHSDWKLLLIPAAN
jgi:hypothetical protein